MVNEVYGKKIGMTQIFSEDGTAIPVTAVVVEPLTIVAKNQEREYLQKLVLNHKDI